MAMSKPWRGMILRQPATRWQDALPCGNGTVGALVHGQIRQETIVLNHEALFLRRPKPAIPDISKHLTELRALLAKGDYREAADFLDTRLRKNGYAFAGVDPYHPAGKLTVDIDTRGAFSRYRRWLDFRTGEATVSWRENGCTFERQTFVSRADDVIVLRIRASGPARVCCDLRLVPHDSKELLRVSAAWGLATDDPLIRFETTVEAGWLMLRGRYRSGATTQPEVAGSPLAAAPTPGPLRSGNGFGGIARVVARRGQIETLADGIRIVAAGEALVLIKLFANESPEAALPRLRTELEALRPGYAALLQRHVAQHRTLFDRMSLSLPVEAETRTANEELLLGAYDGKVPNVLLQRMFDFGRYLLISSSRPGGLPANLQGVWNGDYDPPWQSDYHNDENIQMNYWQALPGNLPEVTLPYFDYYESMIGDYRANARAIYGCRGILASIAQSTHGMAHPGPWLNWTAGAGWLAQLFHDYWLFTRDRKFLAQRAVPFLTEVARFYEDFLIEDANGKLCFSPSLSPENKPAIPDASLATINATMDVAIAREVLQNLCGACRELEIQPEGLTRWRSLLAKLPAYEINPDGAIREWLHPGLTDNYHHRHQSHIYPLFPGLELTRESDAALFEACRVAVQKRLVIGLTSQTGWSMAHMANIYSRLGAGDRALECIKLLTRSCVGPNLLTYHNDWRQQGLTISWFGNNPPFQIDANLGVTAAILEMLVFSKPGWISLLPALPRAWQHGCVKGILCRGAITVDLEWDLRKKRCLAVLQSAAQQEVTVRFPRRPQVFACTLPAKAVAASPDGPSYRRLTLPANRRVRLKIGF